MKFSEIIGHEEIKQRMIRSVKEGRIAHAQLLYGAEGVQKLPLALAYSQYISCENRGENDSCGTCRSCVKYQKINHPDLHFTFPIIKPKNWNAQTPIHSDHFLAQFREMLLAKGDFTADEWFARIADDAKTGWIFKTQGDEIIRKLSMKTFESTYKIMIIWLPERFYRDGRTPNAILKILEEPYDNTVFLLVSNDTENLMETVLSRTQQIFVPKLSENEIAQALNNKYSSQFSEQQISDFAHIADGNLFTAYSLADEGDDLQENFERFVFVMRKAWMVGNKGNYKALGELRQWADKMASAEVGRERQKAFLRYAQRLVRENFIKNFGLPELNYLTENEEQFSNNFSRFINERNIEDIVAELALAEQHTEQNVNAKMIFFDLALKIIVLLKR
ncbi:MAG: DNA polymerase III subunit [Paludibacter sp.]|jgi:DNA polymerase-3 subunit delta'|nr:DNA polymerase III subunit [Paludibacter sp.]